MTRLTLQGNYIHSRGTLPDAGDLAHDFTMVKTDLSEVSLSSFKEKYKLLNIFPSIDTGTCAMSVRTFNKNAAELGNVAVINLSMDLPFAQKRFCAAEGINNVTVASLFRSDFFKHYQLDIIDGPLKGLASRVVIIINEKNEIIYTEQVPEIANEPNYAEAMVALKS
ncbi:thiol peroxidase [Bacteriovorax stolpii]|uniref:Thiol peroxidase n=1 Tax=Bacteriovorax stolpii TaxID=960 RepID=A0A2K9NTL5_BACTC|nr:thiol peroxidase [Bacteriovorax stolpii]AUN98827.1 thiol peroxidase [Bacteriovorax stolpii]QDK41178.1 thiol peroxidase [Bacteriovorax stolpii]TDP55654.1 thiol peroxidase (atypical 2-Cys peroxiredoxin) [Bacteriovorax stolpii]